MYISDVQCDAENANI